MLFNNIELRQIRIAMEVVILTLVFLSCYDPVLCIILYQFYMLLTFAYSMLTVWICVHLFVF